MTSATEWHWESLWQGRAILWSGFLATLGLWASVWATGLALGAGLALLRNGAPRLAGLQHALGTMVALLRNLPLMLLLAFVHYGLLPQLQVLGLPQGDFRLSTWLAMSCFEAAYFSEIIRGGLQAVRPPERESAASLGLTPWQQQRLVILPLALRRMLPALVNQSVTLVKDTSLASIVGVVELTRAGEILYEQTFHDFEVLVFLALVYWTLASSVGGLGRWLEKKQYA
jgi:His/Glu/Gln/Arg/opine family amino acid ABC transporter permease subunit